MATEDVDLTSISFRDLKAKFAALASEFTSGQEREAQLGEAHDRLKDEAENLQAELTSGKEREAQLGKAHDSLKDEAKTLHARVKELEASATGSATASTAKDRVVYVAHNKKIEKLRGSPKPGSRDPEIDEWIGDVTGVIKGRKLDNSEAVQFIKDHLGGDARMEIVSRNTGSIKTPEDIFKILREVFEFGETLPQLRRKFYSKTQKEGESILQFSHILSRLHRRMEQMDPKLEKERDDAMKSQLVDGVRDPELQKEALRWTREQKGTFFELREWANQWTRQGQGQEAVAKKNRVSTKTSTSIESMQSGDSEPLLEAINLIKKQSDLLQAQLKTQQEVTQALKELKAAPTPQAVRQDNNNKAC
ncbi:uncharacterized protein LOC135491062 [Lineus longissimus]|uniref:uncharacterized protein LOC135491062 n=1 Tax=Lineus longissimus TaxID=88925 RepID=UPI00315CD536